MFLLSFVPQNSIKQVLADGARKQITISYCSLNYVSQEISTNNSSGSGSLITIKQSKLDNIDYMFDSIKLEI